MRDEIQPFCAALKRAETYAPHRNPYLLFGFLWGIPVPLVTLGIHLHALAMPWSPESVAACLRESPIHLIFLAHPFLFAVVFGAMGTIAHDRRRHVNRLVGRLRTLATTDGLTHLLNHRAFQERIREEAARAERSGEPVSLAMLDLDRFKQFNDRHGHILGDALLQHVALRLRLLVRPYDVVCRYGGEEFAIILPGLDEAQACAATERLRAEIGGATVMLPGLHDARVSFSAGVATRHADESVEEWVQRADTHLYRAKGLGRNRVVGETARARAGGPA